MEASSHTRRKTLGRGSFPMAVAAALLMLSACAVQKPFHFKHFAPKNISKIYYDPKNCAEMPDGTFKCNNVIFTVAAVDVSPDK